MKTSSMPVPRQQRRRKAAVVAAVLLVATMTGLNLRAVAQEPSGATEDEDNLQRAEAVVKQGLSLEQEGGKLQDEERITIGERNPDKDEILEREEKVLENRVRQTEYLLAEQEEELDKRLSNLGVSKALTDRVKKVQEEKETLRLERQRLVTEEQALRKSEFRLEEASQGRGRYYRACPVG
ncbi:SSP2 [Symbiodinium natans]|uniref:SSP2 protein n=1 Tax=Symbiodinium natans TaxID=878477 RepID=A0A812GYF2_9DINO|nr:SSP2 [Symbiodinium natans]